MGRFRILSLDGGGIRGAFATAFLAEIETRLGHPIGEHFDLIAGTSTGAIIGAGLAYGRSAAELRQFYLDYGREIFHRQGSYKPRGWLRGSYRLVRAVFRHRTQSDLDHFFQARYCPQHLTCALEKGFGDATLAEITHCRLIVPAVNLTKGRTVIFRSPHLPDPDPHVDFRIVDVVRAATAAPTYFPHTTLPDGDAYSDGGLWATNPSILAFAEAMKIQQLCDGPDCEPPHDTSAIEILSIGTGRSTYSLSPPGDDAGILFWSKHVANVMGISQVQGVEGPLEYLLGDRYYHVDFGLLDDSWSLDGAEHMDALMALGADRAAQEFEVVREKFLDDPFSNTWDLKQLHCDGGTTTTESSTAIHREAPYSKDTAMSVAPPDAQLRTRPGHEPLSHAVAAVAADETFGGTWPFHARYTDAPGFRMHYVEEGSGPETLLLLHGEPTWSYLFRQHIPIWAEDYRVIAVDHMGFGRSAVPGDRTYWLQDHIDNLERFVLALDLQNLTLVMHDFGGPVGIGVAIRHPDRIKRIVSVNGPTPAGQPDLIERLTANVSDSPWFQWILKAENEGILEQVLGQLDYNILSTLKLNGFERNEIISNSWLEAYRAPFPTRAHATGAIGWAKGHATGVHEFETPDTATKTELARKPALAIWGEADRTLKAQHFLPLFRQAFPDGQVQRLPGVGHYSPEDAPQQVAGLVADFVGANR